MFREAASDPGGTTKPRDALEKLQKFQQELTEFRDELLRVAQLPHQTNLNDGVPITASPGNET